MYKLKLRKLDDAVDVDLKCYKNSIENFTRNQCSKIHVQHATSDTLIYNKYDLILYFIGVVSRTI